ncbi:MAG: glutaredoxin 3 [Pseudomonadota bacterium]|jgi:glutaredoxin 3
MSVAVKVYLTPTCPYCHRAKQLLTHKGVLFDTIDLSRQPSTVRDTLMQQTGCRTVPQIFIADQFIGGCDDLYALERQGKLDALLAG